MTTYIHYKNSKEYIIVDCCKIQDEFGEWINGIIYKEVNGDILFVRSAEEFGLKFKKKV